jgi:HEAT repeat protein
MAFTSALLALCMFATQAGAGQEPAAGDFVTPDLPTVPSGYTNWRGFTYLGGAPGQVDSAYTIFDDWQKVADGAAGEGAIDWRVKVFLFQRSLTVGRDARGVLRPNNAWMQFDRTEDARRAVRRVQAWIAKETNGAVRLVPEIVVEEETIRDEAGEESKPFDVDFAQEYLAPRVNGGLYDAEDGVYRGPYHSVVYVLPGYADSIRSLTIVNGTPTARLHSAVTDFPYGSGGLEVTLMSAMMEHFQERLRMQGQSATWSPEAEAVNWRALFRTATSFDDPDADVLNERLRERTELTMPLPRFTPQRATWLRPLSSVGFVNEQGRGQVLRYVEDSRQSRAGGVMLPHRGDAPVVPSIDDAPIFSVMAKTDSPDPIAFKFSSGMNHFWVSLGRDPELAQPIEGVVGSARFVPNGTWQRVSIDLRPFAAQAGMTQIDRVSIEPTPNALIAERLVLDASEYFFDEIRFGEGEGGARLPMAEPDFASDDAESRALAASAATETSPQLIAALKDPDPLVRLNAAKAFTIIRDPAAEEALIFAMGDLLEPVQRAAIEAVAHQGTPAAIAALRDTIRFSLSDYAKAQAALQLSEIGEARFTGDIVLLITSSTWQSKAAAVQALAAIPESDPRLRHVFLRTDSPAVRLLAVRHASLQSRDDLGLLQWHAINDPSDLVRGVSYMRLIESGDAAMQAEGYKGVRDDSRFVRVLLLQYMAEVPRDTHKGAILLALTDRAPSVRSAALEALAEFPGDVTLADLGQAVNDTHPHVQLGLIAVARGKKIALPEAVLEAMKQSPDRAVAEGARALGG